MALKIGIVGMGGIGNVHAKVYMDDELAELVAVCDICKEKADKAAEEYKVGAFYSLKEMLDAHPELDIVDVTTSGFENGSWHYTPVMQALYAGKNVLVEKPMSNDVIEGREMVKLAKDKDLYLGCNLNHYFTQPADKAKEMLDAGEIGQRVYAIMKSGFNGNAESYGGVMSPRWRKPYAHTKAFLAHPFSVMRYFCGDVTHIQAFMSKPGIRATAGDLMQSINSVHMQFEDGTVGYILSQRGDASYGYGGWWSFELAGTKSTIAIENCVEKLIQWKGEKAGDASNPMTTFEGKEILNTGITDFNSTFANRLHAYLEDLTNKVSKEALRSSGRDALATLEYTFAAIQSFEEGGALVRPNALPNLNGDPSFVW